jgi:hypothetical protein
MENSSITVASTTVWLRVINKTLPPFVWSDDYQTLFDLRLHALELSYENDESAWNALLDDIYSRPYEYLMDFIIMLVKKHAQNSTNKHIFTDELIESILNGVKRQSLITQINLQKARTIVTPTSDNVIENNDQKTLTTTNDQGTTKRDQCIIDMAYCVNQLIDLLNLTVFNSNS